MRLHLHIASIALLSACVGLSGCVQTDDAIGGDPRDPGVGNLVPPTPADCRPGPGERAYWFELRVGPDADGAGPRMVELIVRHPAGVQPQVTGLQAARESNKELHVRAKDAELSRVVLLASNNLLPLPAGPLACLRVPADSELSFVRSQSIFAPALVEPEPDVIELWPSEVSE